MVHGGHQFPGKCPVPRSSLLLYPPFLFSSKEKESHILPVFTQCHHSFRWLWNRWVWMAELLKDFCVIDVRCHNQSKTLFHHWIFNRAYTIFQFLAYLTLVNPQIKILFFFVGLQPWQICVCIIVRWARGSWTYFTPLEVFLWHKEPAERTGREFMHSACSLAIMCGFIT